MTKFKANEKKEAGRQRKLAAEEAKKFRKSVQKEEELSREWAKGARDTSRTDIKEKKRLEKIVRKLKRSSWKLAENAELEKYKKGSSMRQDKSGHPANRRHSNVHWRIC